MPQMARKALLNGLIDVLRKINKHSLSLNMYGKSDGMSVIEHLF